MNTFTTVLSSLSKNDVRFIVVGGVAVNAHGFQRFTHDIDLVIELSKDNLEKALSVLKELGFKPRIPVQIEEFNDSEKREQWIKEKGMMVFTLISSDLNELVVDIFAEEPFNFEETIANCFRDNLSEEESIPFLDLDSLIEMKQKAGRPHDLRDIEELQLLRNEHSRGTT